MINENDLPEIPRDCKRIYVAQIIGAIIRIKYKKTIKDKFSFVDVYKDGEEKNENSYFMCNMRHKLKLNKNDESFKINEITKIKYIGHSLPNI